MALVIHRRSPPRSDRPRLVIVGGEGRWVRPFLRLVDALGYDPAWMEVPEPRELDRLGPDDLVVAADPRAADYMVRYRSLPRPVVVLTGSLLALSTRVIPEGCRPLPLPVTREHLRAVLEPEATVPDAA